MTASKAPTMASNLGSRADIVIGQAVRIASTIGHFVVLGDHLGCRFPTRHAQQQAGGKSRMAAGRSCRPGHFSHLEPDRFGQQHHADIVQVDRGFELQRVDNVVGCLVGLQSKAQDAHALYP
ncbi:MAG: hypothetical protein MZV65_38510 [Chromatiales bacterium]|nr:hypothetical protein [Chromatiales bacterium]